MNNIRRLKKFLINGMILTITALLMNIIGISFNTYIANKIGPEAIGLYQLVMSVYFFFITLATSGINLTATKIVSEEIAKNKYSGAKIAIRKCIIFSLILGIISGIIILFSSNFICTICLHNRMKPLVLYFIATALPFISMSAAINGYFNAIRRVSKSSIVKISEQIVLIIITSYILSILLPNGIEYACISLILGDVIAEILSFFILFLLYLNDKSKYLNTKSKEKIKNNYTARILKITIPLALSSYIKSFLDTVKRLLIPSRLETYGLSCNEALAKYGILNGMVLPILMFPSILIVSFSSLLIPEMSEYNATNNYIKIRNISHRIFKIAFNFSFCIFGIFNNFSTELGILIYNNNEVGNTLYILSPLVIFIYIDTIIDSILKGLNEQVNVVKCNIIDLFVSIICIYFFLPIYGITGYIIVLFISEILNFSISMRILYKKAKIKFNIKEWIIYPFIYTIITSIIIRLLVSRKITIYLLIIKILLFIIIYLFIMLISKLTKSKLLFVKFK